MSLYQRPGSTVWSYEFELNKVRHRGSCGTSNKTEARAFEVAKRGEAKADLQAHRIGMRRLTLGSLATAWLAESDVHHKDHDNNASRVRKLFGETRARSADGWTLRLAARAGLDRDLMVHEVTQRHIADLKKSRLSEGSSAATWNREVALLQSLLGYAPSLSCVMPNPPIMWKAGRNKAANLKATEPKGKLRWLNEGDERKLLDRLWTEHLSRPGERAPLDSHDLTLLLLSTGARYSECAKLQWSSVDLEAGTVSLYRTKVDNESLLKLPTRTLDMLKRRHKLLSPTRVYVFPAISGKQWHHEDLPRGHATVGIQNAIDALGFNDDPSLSRVTPHTFRDTFASRMVQNGLSLFKVQNLLGHSTPAMTQKYAHLSSEALGNESAAVLNKVYGYGVKETPGVAGSPRAKHARSGSPVAESPQPLYIVPSPHQSPHEGPVPTQQPTFKVVR